MLHCFIPSTWSQARRAGALILTAALTIGCAATTPRQAPGLPPDPKTITRANPGGDAADPVRSALERLATEGWGWKRDKWVTLRVPLADAKNWRRVRLWGYPTRASFRYGDEHYAVATVWYTKTDGPNDPESCMKRFLDHAVPVAKKFDVKVGEPQTFLSSQKVGDEELPMMLQVMDGSIDSLLASDDYVGAVAAHPSFPGTCLVQGFAVVATEHKDLAVQIRDRWVEEGAARITWEKKARVEFEESHTPPETLAR